MVNQALDLRVDVAHDRHPLETLATQWYDLTSTSASYSPSSFQSNAWSLLVARVRLQRSQHCYGLGAASGWKADVLIAIWPLCLQRGAGSWIINKLNAPFGQFARIVCNDISLLDDCVRAVIKRLSGAGVGADCNWTIWWSALYDAPLQLGAAELRLDEL